MEWEPMPKLVVLSMIYPLVFGPPLRNEDSAAMTHHSIYTKISYAFLGPQEFYHQPVSIYPSVFFLTKV